MKHAISTLKPTAVIFDRYFAEEAFSSRLRDLAPEAVRILDMQDLHSLRRHRQERHTEGSEVSATSFPSPVSSSHLQRELASIHRSDLTIVCSRVEKKLLEESYGIPRHKLVLGSFFSTVAEGGAGYDDETHGFDQRNNFVSIGGFKHPPNVDSVIHLAEEVWPRISEELPDAKLHVYGAYPTREVMKYHNPSANILVKGFTQSLTPPLLSNRILLAPLRFGAGIKGKIVDAFRYGLPVVTTPIGAEGIGTMKDFGGSVTRQNSDPFEFAKEAINLYSDRDAFQVARTNARNILETAFDEKTNLDAINEAIQQVSMSLQEQRSHDVFQNILWHQNNRATDYFSRWVELKESLK